MSQVPTPNFDPLPLDDPSAAPVAPGAPVGPASIETPAANPPDLAEECRLPADGGSAPMTDSATEATSTIEPMDEDEIHVDTAALGDYGTPAGSGGAVSAALRDSTADSERRRAGRLPVENVFCDKGQVHDLSSTGMLLRRRMKLNSIDANGIAVMTISNGTITLAIPCKVARETKLGFLQYEYGLQFLDANPKVRKALNDIAFTCRDRRAFE